MKAKYILLAVYGVVVVFLLASVIHSGYLYQFDPDELFHVNLVFLLMHGLVPYRDFFVTYLPLFHWFLAPISYVTGYTFQLVEAARGAMIVLFIVRLLFMFFIARKLFGSLVAYICIPLYLFDPFTVFSGMQIRPDNLMMTFYITGILLVLHWYLNKKNSALPWAGLLLGASAVTLLKNIPATFLITLFILIELWKTRNYRSMANFMLAMAIPAVCFAVWTWYQRIFPSMIQQVVFDAKQLNDTLRYPENILNYYWPPNAVLYGFPGRPISWVYELCLPLLAFAGMFTTSLDIKAFGAKRRLVGWFTAACLLQWVSLLFVRSVFLQYFLSVSWFLALFAATALNSVYKKICENSVYKHIAIGVGFLILTGGLVISWKANNTRAAISYKPQVTYIESQWRIIPNTAVVFPGMLFRLTIYPLGYGVNFVDFPHIVGRFGSPSVYLRRYHIPYVVIDHYNFSFLDEQTQDYVKAHYQKNPQDQNMWVLQN